MKFIAWHLSMGDIGIREEVIKMLGATCQAMGQQLTIEAIRLIADDLDQYPVQDIAEALKRLRKRGGRFSVAAILEFVTALDGRPSPDKAWAMMPKDEIDSAVITQEMAEAWGVASQQFYAGDVVGAQIAFKREYSTIIEAARADGIKPQWFPSLGQEPSRRADAIGEAVEMGRLPLSQASELLAGDPESLKMICDRAMRSGSITQDEYLSIAPPERDYTVGAKMLAHVMKPDAEGKPVSAEEAKKRLDEIRKKLRGE